MDENNLAYSVAVIGAGPAGLYAAQELAKKGVHVTLFNRDIKPGGLAEYGVYPDKLKLKNGFRTAFWQILEDPKVNYFGNIIVHPEGDVTLNEISRMGFQAILISVGAQATKWYGLPGEKLNGVYHAKDLVYFYNKLPPFSQRKFTLGKHVIIIGVGNVMMDIAHYMITVVKAEDVTAIARRGPGEVKFDKAELDSTAYNVDLDNLKNEIERLKPIIGGLDEDFDKPLQLIEYAVPKAVVNESKTRFTFKFLLSPTRIISNGLGGVEGVEFEENRLVRVGDELKAQGTGKLKTLKADTVIFAIGNRVDEGFGLPVQNGEFVKNPNPQFEIDETSYEAFDPRENKVLDGIFYAGWARRASSGLVGLTRKDGVNCAKAILKYLETLPDKHIVPSEDIQGYLEANGKTVVTKEDLKKLREVENEMAQKSGLPEFKFTSAEAMLNIVANKLPV